MGQSLTKNYIHIVFSTKYRRHLIDEQIETDLHKYITGICNQLECYPIRVGGYTDHIHILCVLSKKIALMKLVQTIKANSSKYVKKKGLKYKDFSWQDGYGAFSVKPTDVDIVARYIANQKEHHEKKKFKEEYRTFLKKYKVEYDEEYVWG